MKRITTKIKLYSSFVTILIKHSLNMFEMYNTSIRSSLLP